MRWLLCDYGEVLSLPQDRAAIQRLAEVAGSDAATLATAYWHHRLGYDRGDLSATQYWATVCGAVPTDATLAELVALDVASWTRPNPDALKAVSALRDAGTPTALLSNAPVEIARALDALEWMAPFSPRLFSCDLRRTKPDPAAFEAAIDALGAPAHEVVFVDDREENVLGARAAGLQALHYTDPSVLVGLAGQ